ncbi:hypothetical protein FQZ97_1068200 [compost metagenome]
MAVARVDRGQFAQQLFVQVLAVGQAAEVQGLQAAGLDQRWQGVMRGHGDVDGFAAGQGRTQLLGRAESAIFDADAGFGLEVLQHLRGDIVVPVVDADQLLGIGR